jgi:O-antigen ligase
MFRRDEIFPISEKTITKVHIGLLALVAFALPFKSLVNIFAALALVTWFFTSPFSEFSRRSKFTRVLVAILLFYFLHVFAFFYTSNIQESFFNLEIKLSMLVFPLIFYSGRYTWQQMKFFVTSFVLGCLACCAACLLRAGYLSLAEGKNYFFYQDLSWFQHPSYLAMYLTFCCVALLQKNIFSAAARFLCIVFFSLFVLLLSSKTGIAIHFLFLLMAGGAWYLGKKRYAAVAVFSASAALTIYLVVNYVPPVKERFQNVVSAFGAGQIDKSATESTAVRMLIWGEAKQIMREHPLLGVSPGDANAALYGRYQANGLTGAYAKKLNAHNQYLQTGVGLGLAGLASLLAIFFVPLFNRPRKLLVFFLLITAVNFLTESMLQTMAGSVFFSYFYALLCFDKELNLKQKQAS